MMPLSGAAPREKVTESSVGLIVNLRADGCSMAEKNLYSDLRVPNPQEGLIARVVERSNEPTGHESLEILSNVSRREGLSSDPDTIIPAKELDRLPLALATARAYLDPAAVGLSDYLHLYKYSWIQLQKSSPELDSYENRILYSTWQISFDHIKTDLWLELLRHWVQELTKDETSFHQAFVLHYLVDPFNKTNSEVATINFICQTTDIPVPQILMFDDTGENELGISTCERESVFQYIIAGANGTPQDSQQMSLTLGQIVSMFFFWGDHITQDVPRGPFTNSKDWLCARLTLVIIDQERILKTTDDEDEIEDAQDAKILAERLLKLLPNVFPTTDSSPEQSVLFHDDLSSRNLLIDDDGTITGIVDWECVSTLPLWKSCDFPEFLKGRERNEEPNRNQYAPDDEENVNEPAADALDNEGINELYWIHLLEYESTMLRAVFLDEMQKIAPEWIEESTKGAVKADFEAAVQNCDSGWSVKCITAWLDALEKGENWSLREKLIE
ncbi:hypothetical protein SBOR_3236 [Sclerotinia borealis F-4128]|uniref:non-specific serine/threonine protein kinase n=1 Tax=Sclerotinia borealis (strain F-4128) TaxID=1432307 RepID=W9CP60_SCLBF|nr:hypothetical protein SBOR_3236 [Sclerotinia borealis F-4128]